MGSTESQGSKCRLDKQYRLIRRFVSDLYGGSEVTIVEHKQTKQQFVLKEFILQFNSDKLTTELETHRSLSHRNLIQLKHYWLENDLNICSSLLKVYAILQYHETSLDDYLCEQREEEMGDRQISDFVKQIGSALSFLQRNRVEYLLAGPKSIAVVNQSELEEQKEREIKLASNRRSVSQLFEDAKNNHRKSLVDINREHFRQSFQPQSSPPNKKIYKIFDPLEGLSQSRSLHNLETYLQVPLHPNLTISQEYVISDFMIKQQNILTVTLTALSMCLNCQIPQMDIFKHGRLSLQKLTVKIGELKSTHPRTAKEIMKSFGNPLSNLTERINQGLKIKDISLIKRRRESKINLLLEEDKENLEQREKRELDRAEGKMISKLALGRISSKRISLLQL